MGKGKFYFTATSEFHGTRICKGDLLIVDTKRDLEPCDTVLILLHSGIKDLIKFENYISKPDDAILLGKVVEAKIVL